MSTVICEVGNGLNQSLHFRPLQRKIRGTFDFMRVNEPMGKVRGATEPGPIPGQRLSFDFDSSVGAIIEPLHAPEHRVLKERIEGKGQKLPPEREEFTGQDGCTWAFWLLSAVKAGLVRIVSGKIPENLPGKPRVNFIAAEKQPATDRLAAAIERQNELFAALLETLRTKKR
jgi:hypothetical protein